MTRGEITGSFLSVDHRTWSMIIVQTRTCNAASSLYSSNHNWIVSHDGLWLNISTVQPQLEVVFPKLESVKLLSHLLHETNFIVQKLLIIKII